MNLTKNDLLQIAKVEFDPKGGSVYLLQDLEELVLEGKKYDASLKEQIKTEVGITNREYMNILNQYQNLMFHENHLLMVWHLLEFYQLDKYDLGSIEVAKTKPQGVKKLFRRWYFERGIFIKVPPKFSFEDFTKMIHVESLRSRQAHCINNMAA